MSYPYNIDRNDIKALFTAHESFAESGQAQYIECKWLMKQIKKWFEDSNLEFCAHNAAYFGSKRYEKYYNKVLKRPITKSEYKMLNDEQSIDFENLITFPFEV